jgi:hypothetical protein
MSLPLEVTISELPLTDFTVPFAVLDAGAEDEEADVTPPPPAPAVATARISLALIVPPDSV